MRVMSFTGRLLRATKIAVFSAALTLAPACRPAATGTRQADRLLINEALQQPIPARPASSERCLIIEIPPVESAPPPPPQPPVPPTKKQPVR